MSYVVVFGRFFHTLQTSTDYIYTTKLALHQQIYGEALAKIGSPLM